jgi:alpha-L-fucosidase
VGNEKGIAGKTNWNYLDTAGFTPGLGAPATDILNTGNYNGEAWIPAEVDVSIRPGWFYHANEDDKVKSGETLFDLYLKSVGRGSNLLLNVPPDRRGLIHEYDSAALMQFKKLRDENFTNNLLVHAKTFWEVSQDALIKDSLSYRSLDKTGEVYGINRQQFTVQLPEPAKMNCIVLREAIHLGQTVQGFRIVLFNNGKQVSEISGTTIGRKRILTFPAATVTSFKVYLDDRKKHDNVSGIAAYLIDENLLEK